MENHKQTIELATLLHKSQLYAATRLSLHYEHAKEDYKRLRAFIEICKPIVESKAPTKDFILWTWVSFPVNHIAVIKYFTNLNLFFFFFIFFFCFKQTEKEPPAPHTTQTKSIFFASKRINIYQTKINVKKNVRKYHVSLVTL